MPTYEYFCGNSECIGEFEQYHSITIKLETCPHCQEAGRGEQPIKRLVSGGMGRGIVQLTGKEYTDKIAADGIKMRNEIYSDSNKLANIVGEEKFHQNELRRNRGD